MPAHSTFSRSTKPPAASAPKPNHQRHSSWLVPATVGVALMGAVCAGGFGLVAAFRPDRLQAPAHELLQSLQPWLAGQALRVPARPGLWAAQWPSANAVLVRARADGPAQTVSLCQQLHGGNGDALSLYPMALVAALPGLDADRAVKSRAARNPVVLAGDAARGLPQVWVQGRLADGAAPAALQLKVAKPVAGAAPTWQVGLARSAPEAASGSAHSYSLDQEAWVMWSAPGAATPAGSDAALALNGTARPHSWGVRIQRVAVAGCSSGGLAWQLFDGRPASATAAGRGEQTDAAVHGSVASSAGQAGPSTATLWVRTGAAGAAQRTLRLQLPPGVHQVPAAMTALVEDRRLFEQAVQAGLVQPLADGRVWLAAADAQPGALTKALFYTANGDHVRAQISLANQSRHWLALRLRPVPGQPLPVEAEPAQWRITAGGELLAWQAGLPAIASRLQARPEPGWTAWTRVQAPQAWTSPAMLEAITVTPPAATDGAVQINLPVKPGSQGGQLVLMLLGQVRSLQGARVLSDVPRCDGPGCGGADLLRELTLELLPGARELRLAVTDQPGVNRLDMAGAEHLRVQVRPHRNGSQLVWLDAPAAGAQGQEPAEVTVLAADGQTLYTQGAPTLLAKKLGLIPLVGAGAQHSRSLAGLLARLGAQGHPQAIATTTLEPRYQASLQAVLACVGQFEGQWLPAEQRCRSAPTGHAVDPLRVSAAVLLDARSGAVLVSADGRSLPADVSAEDLLAFDAFNPGGSPLKLPPLQHTGDIGQSAGSAFKLADALTLEKVAQRDPATAAALAGLPPSALDAQAQQHGKAFAMASACYPSPCGRNGSQVQNFKAAPATRYVTEGRFGLIEAIRHSVNTWFAWRLESTDRTVAAGHADAQPLGQAALRQERPLLAVLDELGMNKTLQLDGGLLPAPHGWLGGDVLLASPTAFDPIIDVHGIRQQALGLRMQTTPLQMARLAAAVATGQVAQAHLLLQLNGVNASPAAPQALSMRVDRVQHAMQEVVRAGTAAGAFASVEFKAIRPLIHGKTGSAPLAGNPDGTDCARWPDGQPAPLACLNNAWFIGYLLPGSLPGETRTLAFAVQVSRSRLTGGAHAAGVIAQWLAAQRAQQAPQSVAGLAGAATPAVGI